MPTEIKYNMPMGIIMIRKDHNVTGSSVFVVVCGCMKYVPNSRPCVKSAMQFLTNVNSKRGYGKFKINVLRDAMPVCTNDVLFIKQTLIIFQLMLCIIFL